MDSDESIPPSRLGIDSWAPLKVYKYGLWFQGFKTFGPSETIGGKAALLNKYIKYIKEIEITAG